MIGRTVGHFEIQAELGSGGMGIAYRAFDTELNRPVALKVLPKEALATPGRRERFLREARAASSLNHANIVTIHEIGSKDGVYYIAMELIEGHALATAIPRGGLPEATAVTYAVQIAEALREAHDHGVIHRDLKPQNVMLADGSRVKVLDFGLAKQLGSPEEADSHRETMAALTDTGAVVGTPRYMSPEQAQGKEVDARTDIFSFGCVLFEMLAGRPAFDGASAAVVLSAILRDAPPFLSEIRTEVSADLSRIVSKCLEKDRDFRYAHAADLLVDLRKQQRDSSVSPSAGPPRGGISRAWTKGAVAALLTLTAVGAAAYFRRVPARPRPLEFHLVSSFPGSHRSPSLSPDGRMMAFVQAAADGRLQVFVKHLAGGDPIQITFGELAAMRPRWSPRGDQIVFEHRRHGLWSVPPLGGNPRQIVAEGYAASFSRDGARLVYERDRSLWIADANGANQAKIEGIPPSPFLHFIDFFPAFSPDGQWIAFYRPELGPNGDLWVIPAAGGAARQLTHDLIEGGAPVWMPDGQSIVYPSSRKGARNLWRVPLNGGEPEPLTQGAGADNEPDISLDGRTLIYRNSKDTQALLVLDPRTGVEREILERQTDFLFPEFSPQGDRIAFFGTVEKSFQLFTVGVDGRNLRQVTENTGERNIFPHWSADGSSIYFFRQRPEPSFRSIPAEGGASVTVQDGLDVESQARMDPAGRRFVYTRGSMTDPEATFVHAVEDGREVRLPVALRGLHWSRDGQSILGFTKELHVFLCPSDGTPCRDLGPGHTACFSRNGSRIYFIRRNLPSDDVTLLTAQVFSMAKDGSDSKHIADLGPQRSVGKFFDVSPRDEIAWVKYRPARQELWRADLQ